MCVYANSHQKDKAIQLFNQYRLSNENNLSDLTCLFGAHIWMYLAKVAISMLSLLPLSWPVIKEHANIKNLWIFYRNGQVQITKWTNQIWLYYISNVWHCPLSSVTAINPLRKDRHYSKNCKMRLIAKAKLTTNISVWHCRLRYSYTKTENQSKLCNCLSLCWRDVIGYET